MNRIFNIKSQKELRQKLRNERSVSEKLLWRQLSNSKIGYKFRRQQGIGRYVVDFYCPELKLIIEVDGATHGTEEELKYDQKREDFLKSLGLQIKRYYNTTIKEDLGCVVDDLRDFILKIKNS
jgi:very-short-patch-repair endonuclease